ncbi:MAG: carbohydrate ABC transporter permease [Patescibacteria group bacterium]
MRKRPLRILMTLVLLALSLLFVMPLFFMIVTALKRPEDLATYPMTIMPPIYQWHHFKELLLTNDVIHFWRALGNTLTLTLVQTVIVALSSALAGFGFARYRARGKNFLFSVLLATMMLPTLVTMIPQYILFAQLGIIGRPWPLSYLPLWLPSLPGWAFFIFLYRQFFATLPRELEDAAMIDGCGRLRTFWRIFMPMAGPAIATTCILTFQWTYTEYGGAVLFLNTDAQVLAVEMVTRIRIPNANVLYPLPNIPYQMTVGVMYTLPLVLLFAFAQRYFMQSLVTSGLKS